MPVSDEIQKQAIIEEWTQYAEKKNQNEFGILDLPET